MIRRRWNGPSPPHERNAGLDRRLFLGTLTAVCGAAMSGASFSMEVPSPTAQDWQSVLESLFPQVKVAPALYAIPAGALVGLAEKNPPTRQQLETGWHALNRAAGGEWATATPKARNRALAVMRNSPLFSLLRQTTVFTFYNNHDVWVACGYEGDAWVHGGYSGPGLVTIEWLPRPPGEAPLS